jgi:hypothetical protein
MLRRLSAVLVLAGLVQGYRPSPGAECEGMVPMSGATLLPASAPLPGACGQEMTAAQCQSGPCATLPQTLTPFAHTPKEPIAIEFFDRFHNRTPPPPEPPPPQA